VNADHNKALVIRKGGINSVHNSRSELVGTLKQVHPPRANLNPRESHISKELQADDAFSEGYFKKGARSLVHF
jgi:hypothetical protein